MVYSRLAILLAERLMTISELHRQTGINRVTLTSLYKRKSKGISFATLSQICKALDCSVGDILEYREDLEG